MLSKAERPQIKILRDWLDSENVVMGIAEYEALEILLADIDALEARLEVRDALERK